MPGAAPSSGRTSNSPNTWFCYVFGVECHTFTRISAKATARQGLAGEQVRSQDLETRLAERTAALAALERQRLAVEAARGEAEAALATLTGQHAAVVEERDRLANALQTPAQDGPATTPSKPAKGTGGVPSSETAAR